MVTCKGDVCVFSTVCKGAAQVFLVGDFNNWSTTAQAMEPGDGGLWQTQLKLRPGTYRFAYFVINSRRWGRHDPDLGLTSLRPDARASTITIGTPQAPRLAHVN
jgi:1,4-alpha-glucan branching enzyme